MLSGQGLRHNSTRYAPVIEEFLKGIRKKIRLSRATNNKFFQLSTSGWSTADVAMFGPQYLYVTREFPSILSKLAGRVPDHRMLALLADVLSSELGRTREPTHAKLFEDLLRAAGLKLFMEEMQAKEYTKEFLTRMTEVYVDNLLPVSLGAQFALEAQAKNMLVGLRAGFLSMGLSKKAMDFFAIHLDADNSSDSEEDIHIQLMEELISDFLVEARSVDGLPQAIEGIELGVNECLAMWEGFWEAAAQDVLAGRVRIATAQR
jgi:pyrroloquinoline quinone (PQQ) biosynthesis protein C